LSTKNGRHGVTAWRLWSRRVSLIGEKPFPCSLGPILQSL
jgi:hypothetical protein